VLVVAVAAVLVVSFATATLLVVHEDVSVYFLTSARLWEPAVGALVALLAPVLRLRSSLRLRRRAGACALVLLMTTFVATDGSGWPAWPALPPVLALPSWCWGRVPGRDPPRPPCQCGARLARGDLLPPLPLALAAGHGNRWTRSGQSPSSGRTRRRRCRLGLAPHHWGRGPAAERGPAAAAMVALRPGRGERCAELVPRIDDGFRACAVLAPPIGAQAPGATVLPSAIDLVDHPKWSGRVDWVLPSPLQAPGDVPRAYADGCQQGRPSSEPLTCTYGDPDAASSVALVGDSKALQWLPALDAGRRPEDCDW
jgi:hypothetical protein